MSETADIKCPKCGEKMVLREGYKGKFYGCSKFPECKGTMDYAGEQEKCSACGSSMVLKNGKNGRFYSCSKYPECKNTKNYKETCPKCGSDMQKKTGQKGDFWGCVKYPECKGTRNIGPTAFGQQAGQSGQSNSPDGAKTATIEDTTDYSDKPDENPF